MGDVAVESLTDYHVKEGTSTCPAAEQEEDSMEDRTHLDKYTDPDSSQVMAPEELARELGQLQDMVKDMKSGFSDAIQALSTIQYGDQILEKKVDDSKQEYQEQLADVVQMVLSLKTEFGSVVGQLHVATEGQKQLSHQVEHLQYERDILLEELVKAGAISDNVRQKYHTGLSRPNSFSLGSGANLSVLLEKAHAAFQNGHVTSDHDSGVNTCQHGDLSSCGEATPPTVLSPMVQSFIAGLQQSHDPPPDENYYSDSSITRTANKSLNLSRSLGEKCMSLAQSDSSDEEGEKEKEKGHASPFVNRTSSTPMRRVPPHELTFREGQRQRIAKELVETERKYCSCLWTVFDTFAEPLKQSGLVSAKDASIMFPACLSAMYEHHCNLLHKMEERLLNWKWQGLIGDVFARITDNGSADLLQLYTFYVQDFPSSLNMIRKYYRQSSKFRKFLKKCQRLPSCEGLDLGAFLLTPIQRIPRYVLLLKQLLKVTDADHPDYFLLETALDKLVNFLDQLNDSIENSMQIVNLEAEPKPKRKLRPTYAPSSVSSVDVLQSSSMTRDSGIHSHGEDASSLSRNKSRMGVSSLKGGKYAPPLTEEMIENCQHNKQKHTSSTYHDAYSNRDFTFSHGENATLPSRGKKKNRKSKTMSASQLSENMVPSKPPNGYSGELPRIHVDEANIYESSTLPTKSRRSRNQRPKSMLDQFSENSFHSQVEWADQQDEDENYSSMPRQKNRKVKVATHSLEEDEYLAYELGQSLVNMNEASKNTESHLTAYTSMPRLPRDYGIYGDEDIIEDNDYSPSIIEPEAPTRKAQKMGLAHRSKSLGTMVGSESPSQQQINMALARSLTEAQLVRESKRSSSSTPEDDSRPNSRPNSSTRNHAVEPVNPPPERVKHNVWNESQSDLSVADLHTAEDGGRRQELMKKRKESKRQLVERLNKGNEAIKQKKKNSLRDSLRNIFFRKRRPLARSVSSGSMLAYKLGGSRVVEIGSSAEFSDFSQHVDHQGEITDNRLSLPQDGELITPQDINLQADLSGTYEDENGDPCSAV